MKKGGFNIQESASMNKINSIIKTLLNSGKFGYIFGLVWILWERVTGVRFTPLFIVLCFAFVYISSIIGFSAAEIVGR